MQFVFPVVCTAHGELEGWPGDIKTDNCVSCQSFLISHHGRVLCVVDLGKGGKFPILVHHGLIVNLY